MTRGISWIPTKHKPRSSVLIERYGPASQHALTDHCEVDACQATFRGNTSFIGISVIIRSEIMFIFGVRRLRSSQ